MIFQRRQQKNISSIRSKDEKENSIAISHNAPDEKYDAIPHKPFKSSINLIGKHPYLRKAFQDTRIKLNKDYRFPQAKEVSLKYPPPANSIAKSQNEQVLHHHHKRSKSSLIAGANMILLPKGENMSKKQIKVPIRRVSLVVNSRRVSVTQIIDEKQQQIPKEIKQKEKDVGKSQFVSENDEKKKSDIDKNFNDKLSKQDTKLKNQSFKTQQSQQEQCMTKPSTSYTQSESFFSIYGSPIKISKHSSINHRQCNPLNYFRDFQSSKKFFAKFKTILKSLKQIEKKTLGFESPISSFSPLHGHNISEQLRTRMVDWMMEVTSSFRTHSQILFVSIALFDFYLKKSREKKLREIENEDVHLIGVCCMLIANKICDAYFYDLSVYIEKISHNAFSTKQILAMEFNILKVICFETNIETSYECLKLYFGNAAMCLYELQREKSKKYSEQIEQIFGVCLKRLQDVSMHVLSAGLHSSTIVKIQPSYIALASFRCAIKLCKTSWNFKKDQKHEKSIAHDFLKKVYKISLRASCIEQDNETYCKKTLQKAEILITKILKMRKNADMDNRILNKFLDKCIQLSPNFSQIKS